MNKSPFIGAFALFLVFVSGTSEVRAGTLLPDSDCPNFVCTLIPDISDPINDPNRFVTLDVVWVPNTENLGFVDVFLEWSAYENDPDNAIGNGNVGSNTITPNAFFPVSTGVDPFVPHTATVTIFYSSQLRPQNDPNPNNCTPSLCTDLSGAQTYTIQVEALPSAVPVPAAVWLFGSGLLGLIGIARRKKAS